MKLDHYLHSFPGAEANVSKKLCGGRTGQEKNRLVFCSQFGPRHVSICPAHRNEGPCLTFNADPEVTKPSESQQGAQDRHVDGLTS